MTERESYKKQVGRVVSYFTSLMALFYLFAGGYLILSDNAHKLFSVSFCYVIGVALIVYGLFRIYRAYMYYKTGE